MDRPEYPQDEQQPGTSKVPSLIHDYRAQRDAWREQARNLARMREEVLAAADREARDIVSAARADVRRILLKARRDLLVLAAQVRAAGRLGDGADDPADTFNLLPADDLGQAQHALTTARNDVRRVLDETRPELEGLASEGEALRAALRHHQEPAAPTPVEVRRHVSTPPVQDIPDPLDPPVDFEFTTIGGDEPEDLTVRHDGRRPLRALITAAATIGGLALMGTGWWLYSPRSSENKADAVAADSPAAQPSAKLKGDAARATNGTSAVGGERRSPAPDSRAPLSIQLSTRETSWVRITSDGRITAERIFKPGETQQVRASREVTIRAGDAGAVTVAVDGRQPVALGREGEVITRRFVVETPPAARATASKPVFVPSAQVAQAVPQRPPTAAPFPAATVAPTPAVTRSLSTPNAPVPARGNEQPPVPSSPTPPPSNPPANASLASRSAAPTVERPPLTPPAPQTSLQDSLTSVSNRFLDAYYRQDRATMASISAQANVTDQRNEKERLPRGLSGVRRSFDDVSFQMVSDSAALLTARMTERMDSPGNGQMAQTVSYVSHVFTQRNGTWQLQDVRIVSAATLQRAVR